jgi:hypothetical protein
VIPGTLAKKLRSPTSAQPKNAIAIWPAMGEQAINTTHLNIGEQAINTTHLNITV